jgi:hypothetical protein
MSGQSWRQVIAAVIFVSTACSGGAGTKQKETEKPVVVASTPTAIDGAWKVAEFKPEGVPAIGDPASLFLFTAGFYSVMYANEDSRAAFTRPDAPTDPEKIGAYDSFIANAGTFDIADDTLVIHPVISKHPGFMGGGEDRFLMRSAGDTLWLTSVRGAFRWANGQAGELTSDSFTLVRAR